MHGKEINRINLVILISVCLYLVIVSCAIGANMVSRMGSIIIMSVNIFIFCLLMSWQDFLTKRILIYEVVLEEREANPQALPS
jgi:hypothetical protein